MVSEFDHSQQAGRFAHGPGVCGVVASPPCSLATSLRMMEKLNPSLQAARCWQAIGAAVQ